MSQYLLSVHSVEDSEPGEPRSPEQMQQFMERIYALEAEMKDGGNFLFTGRLHGPDASTVVRSTGGRPVMTDGPFAEAKEHIAGFYIIQADDLDAALIWAGKVAECINEPIEVRPFFEMPGS